MKNKKALMIKNLVKLVIVALCIIVLVYLAIKLYSSFVVDAAAREKAERTLNQIHEKIETLGNLEEDRYIILAPEGWAIMMMGREIAICDFDDINKIGVRDNEDQFGNCSKEGLMKKTSFNLETNGICFGYYGFENCVELRNLPIEMLFKREEYLVKIQTQIEKDASGVFSGLIEYKKDEDSKNFSELIVEIVELLRQGKSTSAVKNEITETLESFLQELDTQEIFEIEKESIEWHFIIEERDRVNPIIWLQRKNLIASRLLIRDILYEDETYKVAVALYEAQ